MPSGVCRKAITVWGVEWVISKNSSLRLLLILYVPLQFSTLIWLLNTLLSSFTILLRTWAVYGEQMTGALNLLARNGTPPKWSRCAWVGTMATTFSFQSSIAEMSGKAWTFINSLVSQTTRSSSSVYLM